MRRIRGEAIDRTGNACDRVDNGERLNDAGRLVPEAWHAGRFRCRRARISALMPAIWGSSQGLPSPAINVILAAVAVRRAPMSEDMNAD